MGGFTMGKTFTRFPIYAVMLLSLFFQPLDALADKLLEQRLLYMRHYAKDCRPQQEEAADMDFEVLFFDLDGDGNEEALIADKYNRDRSGNGWCVTRKNKQTGRIEYHPAGQEEGLSMSSYPWDLYRVSQNTGRTFLCGQHILFSDIKPRRPANGQQRTYFSDAILKMDSDGHLRPETLGNGLMDIVSDPGFRRINRVATEFYKGTNLVVTTQKPQMKNISPAKTDGIESFVKWYRDEIRLKFRVVRKITVFVVIFDVDQDGESDLYVSSDVETRGEGNFVWHLFINKNGVYDKASAAVWFNADRDYNRESLNPEEIARKDSFYQVQRMYGFAPSIVILDHDGKTLHARAFNRQKTSEPPVRPARHLTYEQQRVYYPLMDEWYVHEKSKLGYIPAYDFDELISRPEFVSLERLLCVEFAEP